MTDDPAPVVIQKSNRTTVITIASISALFVLFVAVLWAVGFFTFSGSDPSSKVVAAALALVGGLVAAVVSIIGIVLKYSIDQRTETRLQIEATRAAADRKAESDRASALQTQAEQRLNLEAAIRAVELLGTKDGADTALQRAGALFALSSLDQHSLTLDLAAYLLEKKTLEPAMACSLIDAALTRGDEAVKRHAVELLYDNAERMITELDTSAPRSILNWDNSLNSEYVRELAVLAMGRILLARPFQVWQSQFDGELCSVLAALALAWQAESNDRLKRDTAAILEATLAGRLTGEIYHPKKNINLDEINARVKGSFAVTGRAARIVARIRIWVSAE